MLLHLLMVRMTLYRRWVPFFISRAIGVTADRKPIWQNPDNPIAGDVANKNRFVVWTGLEAGGQGGGTWYCLDSGD
jgi:hypothetical protein